MKINANYNKEKQKLQQGKNVTYNKSKIRSPKTLIRYHTDLGAQVNLIFRIVL